jgi:hypothetical protein
LLELLGLNPDQAEVDPGRTLVKVGAHLWTLVGFRSAEVTDAPSLRRAGAKHKRVR